MTFDLRAKEEAKAKNRQAERKPRQASFGEKELGKFKEKKADHHG